MAKPQCCGSCRYQFSAKRGALGAGGELVLDPRPLMVCRRVPPVPLVVPAPSGLAVLAQFPEITEDQWCGEWAPAERAPR